MSPGASFKLELSPELRIRGIHDVFHASLLRAHIPNDDRRFPGRQMHQIPGFGVNPKEWAVDRILSHVGKGKDASFEIRWATGDVTWAPFAEVKHLSAMDHYCEAMGITHPRNLPNKETRDGPEVATVHAKASRIVDEAAEELRIKGMREGQFRQTEHTLHPPTTPRSKRVLLRAALSSPMNSQPTANNETRLPYTQPQQPDGR
ncbi:DNA/RNA polymerase [Mycena indigotica]|uniref:DNA/RNA polymerase n=1 Tax=Mycena indigotica TaxID=2126181 RepID=A0A8H6SEE7_9AGAR|nr:DNA/RNA polymerase [Mycena indigotica]KAF7296817.1 DNA/RNA polymerase [Mycena indigotica]